MTADQFKQTRLSLGLSINEMASAIGTVSRTVRHYETGERAVSGTVQRLLEYIEEYGVLTLLENDDE